jgi:hypothetical protein
LLEASLEYRRNCASNQLLVESFLFEIKDHLPSEVLRLSSQVGAWSSTGCFMRELLKMEISHPKLWSAEEAY